MLRTLQVSAAASSDARAHWQEFPEATAVLKLQVICRRKSMHGPRIREVWRPFANKYCIQDKTLHQFHSPEPEQARLFCQESESALHGLSFCWINHIAAFVRRKKSSTSTWLLQAEANLLNLDLIECWLHAWNSHTQETYDCCDHCYASKLAFLKLLAKKRSCFVMTLRYDSWRCTRSLACH